MATETRSTQSDGAPLPKRQVVDAYEDWQRKQGIPLHTGFYVEDVNTVEVAPWPQKGAKGAVIQLDGTGGVNDTHVVEIPPGGSTTPERHLYEETVYVISGRGATSVWYDESRKQTFEWGPGSVFAVPLNAWAQFFNGSGTEPARYMAVTNLPTVIRLFHNDEFVFNNDFAFRDRFSDESDFFRREGKLFDKRILETNFVADVSSVKLLEWKERGAGGVNVQFELAHNSSGAHVSEFPVGTYKKGHRHGPGAHVIILSGHGYSLLWKEGQEDNMTRVDWKAGSMVVPPEMWFHQHFNPGTQPARYLALRYTGKTYKQPMTPEGTDVDVKEGGLQIEYDDENPEIHKLFERELAQHGAECRMRRFIPWCTGKE